MQRHTASNVEEAEDLNAAIVQIENQNQKQSFRNLVFLFKYEIERVTTLKRGGSKEMTCRSSYSIFKSFYWGIQFTLGAGAAREFAPIVDSGAIRGNSMRWKRMSSNDTTRQSPSPSSSG